jgi:hypothetical protein
MISAVCFDGNAHLEDSCISNSTIENTSIDMNLLKITNLGTPTNPRDAATKAYVDAHTCGNNGTGGGGGGSVFSLYTVTLSSTMSSLVTDTLPSGNYIIKVTSLVTDGPTAKFDILNASISTVSSQVTRNTSSPGISGNSSLLMNWDNTGLYLYKTDTPYDGDYEIRIA